MRNFVRFVGVCIVFVAIAMFGAWAWNNVNAGDDETADNPTSTQSKPKPSYTVNEQGLAAIESLVSQNADLDMSVALTDLQTGKTYHYGDDASYTAASVGKLITAATFLNNVEKGTASLNDPVGGTTAQEEIRLMLVKSDNTAWKNMENTVHFSGQQAYAESIGINSYTASTNTISSSDIALLLTKLSSGKLFNDEHTQLVLGYMQQANYRQYIVAAIPSDVTVYHKVGFLEDRLHDAAIIKKGDRSYVLVIFSKSTGNYDFNRGATLFGSITQSSLQAFLGQTSQPTAQ